MAENSIIVADDMVSGQPVATVAASEIDDEGRTRYHQSTVFSERKVSAWTSMRGAPDILLMIAADDGDADVGLYNGTNLIDQASGLAAPQITIGDKTKLIVSVAHFDDEGSVDITPMVQFPLIDDDADDDEDVAPLETKTATMDTSPVKFYKAFFVSLAEIEGYPDTYVDLYVSKLLVWDNLCGAEKVSLHIGGLSPGNMVYVRAAVV